MKAALRTDRERSVGYGAGRESMTCEGHRRLFIKRSITKKPHRELNPTKGAIPVQTKPKLKPEPNKNH
jgi:hypothetical protein